MTAPPPKKINIYILNFFALRWCIDCCCAPTGHIAAEARGISRALMLDWLKSAELNTPPPSKTHPHLNAMWTTPIKVCTSSIIYFYLFLFGAGCVQNHSLKKCCKGPNRATGLCEQLGGLRPCSCSWAFCLPRNKCRELLRTLWLVGFCLFSIF